MRVAYHDLLELFGRALAKTGMEPDRAALCAKLFADSTCDGVSSHGVNRFPRFMKMIETGVIDVHARPVRVAAHGSLERWDGRQGPGNLNAYDSMARAIALTRDHGIGCVALANTNHWMRGGTYGWQAAEAGAIGICWTNTLANVPPWGATDPRIGNNPLVVAVPRPRGHVVLDMAMSQFSVGALASYRMRGEQLPVEGGYDAAGRLTRDPAAIETTRRLLPIGYWKGSGLSIMLDLVGAILSGGLAAHQIESNPERETALSQLFIACAVNGTEAAAIADAVVASVHGSDNSPRARESRLDREGERSRSSAWGWGPTREMEVRYPGERTLETREKNVEQGIPIEESVWREIHNL